MIGDLIMSISIKERGEIFKAINAVSKKVNGVTFIWFTDGIGWNSASKNLEETFNELKTMYNINDLENGILNELDRL